MDALLAAVDGFAPALASALLHSLWQCALLAAAAALTLRAMARASAAWRHTVGMAFLLAMPLAPAFQMFAFGKEPLIDAALFPLLFADAAFMTGALAGVVGVSWLIGAGLMLVRYAAGLRTIAVMERRAFQPLPAQWQARVDELRRAMRIGREVAVRLSDDVVGPCAARLLRPVIWLPLSLLARAPVEQIEALLAHELAHVARRDWLWNGLQCVVEALLFYHPAVWWLGRRVRQEREHAVDDLAVAACGGNSIALAEALASLARERPRSALVLAARGGSLLQRVTRLLAETPPQVGRRLHAVLGAIAVVCALLAGQISVAGGRAPGLVLEASTTGELGPGDYLQITANDAGTQRFYRVSLDAQRRVSEVYRENGEARAIDDDVRRWVERVRMGIEKK